MLTDKQKAHDAVTILLPLYAQMNRIVDQTTAWSSFYVFFTLQ